MTRADIPRSNDGVIGPWINCMIKTFLTLKPSSAEKSPKSTCPLPRFLGSPAQPQQDR